MSKKLYALISGIVSGVFVIIGALSAYFIPDVAPSIIASLGIVEVAINEVLLIWIKQDDVVKKASRF